MNYLVTNQCLVYRGLGNVRGGLYLHRWEGGTTKWVRTGGAVNTLSDTGGFLAPPWNSNLGQRPRELPLLGLVLFPGLICLVIPSLIWVEAGGLRAAVPEEMWLITATCQGHSGPVAQWKCLVPGLLGWAGARLWDGSITDPGFPALEVLREAGAQLRGVDSPSPEGWLGPASRGTQSQTPAWGLVCQVLQWTLPPRWGAPLADGLPRRVAGFQLS